MDIVQLYQDYSVDFRTEGHKHCRPGWVNTPCPHCTGNAGYHLGFELQGNYYYCWRCGWHPIITTLALLLKLDEYKTRTLVSQYGILVPRIIKSSETSNKEIEHRMPSNTGPLSTNHKRYLESRGYDSDLLERTWLLVGTGPVSLLDGIDYNHRILAPVLWDYKQVSFQGRDITGKDILKYRACPKNRELIHHKEIIYGKQEAWYNKIGICVEGITDVWRMGIYSFGTFGIKYTPAQLKIIAKTFNRVFVCYDGPSETSEETQAKQQAKKLVAELKFRGVDAFKIDIKGDPGSMEQSEADYLVKQLIK